MTELRMALRLLVRDARAGELTLLAVALMVAVSSTTAISLFADRLQRTLTLQAAEFIAGDLVLTGSSPIDRKWLDRAHELELEHSETTEFTSVLLEHDEILLVSVKAVSANYPLRGSLMTRTEDTQHDSMAQRGPDPGKAWVEARVLSSLQLRLGDTLTVGDKPLLIERMLTYEPDKRGDFYSFSPRVMISQSDLQATGVIQPGSHVHYFYQFVGGEADLLAFKAWLKPQLNPSQRILDIHEDRPELGSTMRQAERYLGLSSIMVILIAGVAIAMAGGRYAERHFNTVALLRCMGCRQRDITTLFALQFIALGLLVSGMACAVGWLGQQGLFQVLKPLLPRDLAQPGPLAVALGFITGLVILFGFSTPPLLRLRQVSPLRVLQRDLRPLPAGAWLIYGLAILVVAVLIERYTRDLPMTLAILGGGMLILLLLALLTAGLLRLFKPMLPYLGVTWRFGVQGLMRNTRASVVQVLAFSITLAAMALSLTVRNDLIEQWRRQLPEHAPNHFALNIIPEQLTDFKQQLQQANIVGSAFYPVVRGRLVAINAEPVQQRVSKDSRGEAAIRRDLALTWAQALPDDNVITAGAAWSDGQPGLVSVEQKLAENLNINVGDHLSFTVGSERVDVTVANLRSLEWDTMRPNFYMIFSPGSLDRFPATYLTSFYLPDGQKSLLSPLLKSFPATTVLEVDQILRQLRGVVRQLTQAVDLLLYFALLAGFTLLFAAVYATLDRRIEEGALLRALGAKRAWLRRTHAVEFGLLGGLAGGLAGVLSQLVLSLLYSRVMHMAFQPELRPILVLSAIGAASVGLAGYLGVRPSVNQSPMRVLQQS
jgi:putative ABC transport system permease protein